MPFLIELLKCLAKEDKLVPLIKEAQQKAKAATAVKKEGGTTKS